MDIKNALEAYLQELDNMSNFEKDFRKASRSSNLGRHVQQLINKLDEFESEGI